ncbi:response regulator [Negadavirga shengliensis]|uniref:Response regulator n=1 Tax=Negadavirga shengliensis TaxID=1389218 RepID=A0ABV9SWU7_9BACT
MTKRAMIVDDDEGVLFLHELMLVESNFAEEILSFNDAQDALDYLEKGSGNDHYIVFLDINMPKTSGWDFLNQLEHGHYDPKIHVIMVTSSINQSDRKRAEKFNHVVYFVEKPLDIDVCERLKKMESLKELFNKN